MTQTEDDAIADACEAAALPAGKTCRDCMSFRRCSWLISCAPTNDHCDWSPSRFQPAPAE
jgi:hypothetical protein